MKNNKQYVDGPNGDLNNQVNTDNKGENNQSPKYFKEAKYYSSSEFLSQLRNNASCEDSPICQYVNESETICTEPAHFQNEVDTKKADKLKAVYWLKKTLEVDPQNQVAAQLLVKTLDDLKDYEELHKVFMQLFPLHNSSPEFMFSFARFMILDSPFKNDEEKIKSSISILNECKEKGLKIPLLEYYTAKAHFNLGDFDNCCLYLELFFKTIRNYDEPRCMVVFEVSKNDALNIQKHIARLEKDGDKVLIKEIDKKEDRNIKYGPIIELDNNSKLRIPQNVQ